MSECTCPADEDFIGIDDAIAAFRSCPVHGLPGPMVLVGEPPEAIIPLASLQATVNARRRAKALADERAARRAIWFFLFSPLPLVLAGVSGRPGAGGSLLLALGLAAAGLWTLVRRGQ